MRGAGYLARLDGIERFIYVFGICCKVLTSKTMKNNTKLKIG